METKNAKKTNETFKENAEQLNDWFNATSSTANEIYKRQLNLAFGFYNNMFNSMLNMGKNNWGGSNINFVNPFNGDGKFQSFFNPFSWMNGNINNLNPFVSYENFIDRIIDYNKNQLNTIQNYFQLRQNDWVTINEKYQELAEERWETIKNMVSTLNDAFSRQLDYSVETNKKVLSDLNKQIDRALKSNAEFWETVVNTYQSSAKEETEKSNKPIKREVHQYS